jgi:hypothetical protein
MPLLLPMHPKATHEHPTPPDGHQHHTGANKHVQFAATASTIPSPTLDANTSSCFDHFALHGNAFNPDTGQLVDYIELSKCSALYVARLV